MHRYSGIYNVLCMFQLCRVDHTHHCHRSRSFSFITQPTCTRRWHGDGWCARRRLWYCGRRRRLCRRNRCGDVHCRRRRHTRIDHRRDKCRRLCYDLHLLRKHALLIHLLNRLRHNSAIHQRRWPRRQQAELLQPMIRHVLVDNAVNIHLR